MMQIRLITVGNMNSDVGTEPQESSSQNLKCIRCPDCGEEIMMVPVLAQMIEAIENHISTHKEHEIHPKADLAIGYPKAPCIRENLTEQVLTRAAEISDILNRNQHWVDTK
jgi:DNA-directed RNA polymerase subunit RPC12/RpoP